MRIDDNAEALAMMKRALGSLEAKIREAYNKGYRDGVKSMVAEGEPQREPTWEEVEEYCKKRCLDIVDTRFVNYFYNQYLYNKQDEPQTDYRITGTIGYRCPKCGKGNFLSEEPNCVYCGEPLIKDEPQTDCAWK